MTPVILTGGIDLSVGSLMGLCAVVFGISSKEFSCSPWQAAAVTLATGTCGGLLNAALITKLNLPPLIVTLGTFSLYRGLAEALTQGSKAYSGFAAEFLAIGNNAQGAVPFQLWILLSVFILIYLLVHHTTLGRSWRAIGYTAAGARYAGLPVTQRLNIVYALTGAVTGLAAILFVARLGEARANAGVGFELLAITAVVLGGTRILGGSGNVLGTLLGWLTLAILTNGLSRIPSIMDRARELSSLMTGGLLLLALTLTVGLKRLQKTSV
jgi:rhamnose transport system permease protein